VTRRATRYAAAMPDLDGRMGAIFGITILGVLASVRLPIGIILVIVCAIRRGAPARRDPAEEELRDRVGRK